jgi:hypothetical protein
MTSDRDFAEADALWEFVANPDQPPRDDVERTVRRVQGVVGAERTVQAMPRDRIWSEVVTSVATPPGRPSPAASGFVPALGWTRRRVGRWSSVVSYGLMVAVVFSLLGIAHDRVMSPALATPAPELIASDFISTEGTPVAEDGCVARDVTWEGEADPAGRPAVQRYQPIMSAPEDIGAEAMSTYIGFMTCLLNVSASLAPEEDAVLDTYLTANAQQWNIDQMYGAWPVSDRIGNGWTIDRQITSEMVIPVNRPLINFQVSENFLSDGSASIPIFLPGDVYELVDGRYGVVIGSVSSEAFREGRTGSDPFAQTLLTFVGFEEQNGQLFIDEIRDFCTGAWLALDANGQPTSTPMSEGEIGCR